jgi:hypothetical protein
MYFLIWYYELRPSVWYKRFAWRMKGTEDWRKIRMKLERLELERPKYISTLIPKTK